GVVRAAAQKAARTDGASVEPGPPRKANGADPPVITQVETSAAELDATFIRIISSPTIACKEWVYLQYDHMVRTNTVVLPGSDAAVIRIKEKRRQLVMALDSDGGYCKPGPAGVAEQGVAVGGAKVEPRA